MRRTLALTATTLSLLVPVSAVAPPADAGRLPSTYPLTGDATDPAGSKFEGIGVTHDQRTFYVTEVTGGEIHRGSTLSGRTEEWMAPGADDRFTARGITTDRQGRVYVAGGPNGIGTGRPDLWVYDRSGRLLAKLRVGVDNAFLNDVAIGPDGAAYFTNSNSPQVFRVAPDARGRWQSSLWADATGTIPVSTGFNLGGIVVAPDRSALVVAQGNTGMLWRFDLRTRAASQVATGSAPLVDADGLVARGRTLHVVRNFSKALTRLRLSRDGFRATLVADRPTDPNRVLTTAKLAQGRLLLVDSKFDEPVAAPPYEVVALRVRR